MNRVLETFRVGDIVRWEKYYPGKRMLVVNIQGAFLVLRVLRRDGEISRNYLYTITARPAECILVERELLATDEEED